MSARRRPPPGCAGAASAELGLGSFVGVRRVAGGLPPAGSRGGGEAPPEGVTVDVGPKTPGAGRKADAGRPLPRPGVAGVFGRGGRWARRPGFRSLQPLLEELPGAPWGSPRRVPGSGLWGGPSDIAPGAGWKLPWRGRGRAELPGGTAGGRRPHRRRGSGASERGRGRGGRRGSGPAAAGRYPDPAFKSAASRRRPRR